MILLGNKFPFKITIPEGGDIQMPVISSDHLPHATVVNLHMADHYAYVRANQIFKQFNVTMQQAMILRYLYLRNGEHTNQKDIEHFMGISNPSVTSLMKTMVGKDFIRRMPDRSDARSYLLELTARGVAIQDDINAAFIQLES